MDSDDRKDIDPDGRYPAPDLRESERWARVALELLPDAEVSRTREVIQLNWGGDTGIVLFFTPDTLEIRQPSIEWTGGAYGPAESSVLWRRVEYLTLEEDELEALLDECKRDRKAQFLPCKYCGEAFPPEHRISEDVCHSCASEHEGVVF